MIERGISGLLRMGSQINKGVFQCMACGNDFRDPFHQVRKNVGPMRVGATGIIGLQVDRFIAVAFCADCLVGICAMAEDEADEDA